MMGISLLVAMVIVACDMPLRGGSVPTAQTFLNHEPFAATSNTIVGQPFHKQDEEFIVNKHNYFRGHVTPQASNMEFMQWDVRLAEIAQLWAEECVWVHGLPQGVVGTFGQNMWAEFGSSREFVMTPMSAMKDWYEEKFFYDYENNDCAPGEQCGHYTQIVWAKTNRVGCGRAFCPLLDGRYKHAWIIVCQYSPTGNIRGFQPYLVGQSCSRCASGSGQCYRHTCRPCWEHNDICECKQNCDNCGVVDASCRCKCLPGFRGIHCTDSCKDLHPFCGVYPGWPNRDYCRKHFVIPYLCPSMCGTCSPSDSEPVCPTTSAPIILAETTETHSTTAEELMIDNQRFHTVNENTPSSRTTPPTAMILNNMSTELNEMQPAASLPGDTPNEMREAGSGRSSSTETHGGHISNVDQPSLTLKKLSSRNTSLRNSNEDQPDGSGESNS